MGSLDGTKALYCEARHILGHLNAPPATHVYGPECEADTGKLMYLCSECAERIRVWIVANPTRPVKCPTHGIIGMVKNYVILKRI